MAEPITLPFEGDNRGLKESLTEIRDLLLQVRDGSKQAQAGLQADAQKSVQSQEEVNRALNNTIGVLAQLDKQSKTGGAGKLADDFDRATESAEKFGEAGSLGVEEVTGSFEGLVREAKKAAQQQGIVVKAIDKEKQAAIDLLVSMGALTKEEGNMATEAMQVLDAYKAQNKVAAEGTTVLGGQVEQAVSLRTQLQNAKNELAALAENGAPQEQINAAAQRAGELANRLENVNKQVQAFNPGARFAAFGQVLQSIAGAGTAVQGIIGLIGNESEDLQRTLLKVQSALAISQGLNAFFGGFSDGLKNLRALLGGVTKAQVASTAATEADVAAKAAQATATAGAATATTTLTASVLAFTASLLTNPIFLAIAALTALAAILLTDSENADKAKESFDKLFDSALKFRDLRDQQLKQAKALRDADRDLQEVNAGDNLTEQARIRKEAIDDEIQTTKLLAKARGDLANILEEDLNRLVKAGQIAGKELEDERDKIAAIRQEAININNDAILAERQGAAELARIAKQRIDQERANAQERKKIREQLAKDLADIEKQIADLLKQQTIEQADPQDRVFLEKKAADDQIDLLEQTLKRKLALVQLEKELTVKAFNELTEAEKNARADAAIEEGRITLDPAQVEAFNNARLNAENKFFDDLAQVLRDRSRERVSILQDTAEQERRILELDLEEKEAALRKAGATEAEILDFQRRKRAELEEKIATESLSIQQRIALAEIDQIDFSGSKQVAAEEAKQRQILQVKIRFAEQALLLIAADGSAETTARIEEARALVATLKRELAGLDKAKPIDLFDLLGFKFSDEEKQRIIQGLGEIASFIASVQQAAAQEIQQNISATDQIISDRERRIEDLRSRLDQELELNKQGFANNIDLIRQQIAEEERAAEQDKARRISLLEQQKRIARQQLAIDAVVQASQLATAATKVFSSEAIKGIPGIIGAIGFIASMLAAFVSFKARANSIANEGVSLKEGGLLEGPSHDKGGIAMMDRRSGKYMAEAEGGEFVINRRSTVRYRDLIEAVNENDFAKARRAALEQFGGMSLENEATQLFVEQRREIHANSTINAQLNTKSLEKKVERTTQEVARLRDDMDTVEVEHHEHGRVERSRGVTRKVRR